MLFNSFQFAIFFPIIASLYFATPQRFRWILLLVASYYFYMSWKPVYALLLIATTIIDFTSGQMMSKSKSKAIRRGWLMASLSANFGFLFSFKYYNFFCDSLQWLSSFLPPLITMPRFDLILPVGISFYTFQAVSYTIDVYRGNHEAEKNLGYFALYVSFFPQLVAGPIERPGHILPQLKQQHNFSYDRVTNGLKLMAWGLFKKVVIADRLAMIVDPVYNDPSNFTGPILIFATACFALQIYCDFSGYTDIAIGAASILGISLMRNFNQPYLATSIVDFWRRWHISLTSWFRDYLYISLGGNRVSTARWRINIIIVFLVSGLWHGASWTFVIWGAIHGIVFILSSLTRPFRQSIVTFLKLDCLPGIHQTVQVILTFIIVCFAWIFFRANNLSDAYYIVSHLLTGWSVIPNSKELSDLAYAIFGNRNFRYFGLLILNWAMMIGVMFLVEHYEQPLGMFRPWPRWVRWPAYWVLVITILLLGSFRGSPFIYFQF